MMNLRLLQGGYEEALKLGLKAVRQAEQNGRSPYLPVLDSFLTSGKTAGEIPLGTMDIPVDMIAGNKTQGRNNSFAPNWMPVMDLHSEFAVKWGNLCESCSREGVRDAIECYEYLNHYYVQEGNKRVSVSKFLGIDYIPAKVTRILPVRTGDKSIQVYYEFHDFSLRSHIFDIIMNEPGQYARLSEMYGQTIMQEWPEDAAKNLNSAWNQFVRAWEKLDKKEAESVLGPSFLAYLNLFGPSSFESDSVDQITGNIRSARAELERASLETEFTYIDEDAADCAKKKSLSGFLGASLRYSKLSPLKTAMVYGEDIEDSRWSDMHEAGMLFAEQMLGENVKVSSYKIMNEENGLAHTLKKAVDDGNKLVFTITPDMAEETERASIRYPEVHFLNCSLGLDMESVRCYSARMYEATFLMGVQAALTLQNMQLSKERNVIGYLGNVPTRTALSSVNAFAIGVSVINPECRIDLKWSACPKDSNYKEDWQKAGIRIFADANAYREGRPEIFASLLGIDDSGQKHNLGISYYSWGRYYTRIIQSVLDGSYDANSLRKEKSAKSYWFGLSSSVVDMLPGREVPQSNRKLLSMLKNSIVEGSASPFSGTIRTTDKREINPEKEKSTAILSQADKMTLNEIASIDWLYENIIGEIPGTEDLDEYGKHLMRVMRISR